MPVPLSSNIECIRLYTRRHPELHSVPYFLFDLHLDKQATDPPVVVMGINPGRPKKAEELIGPTEETSLHDFHDTYGQKRHELTWTKKLVEYCGTRNIVQTELFFGAPGTSRSSSRCLETSETHLISSFARAKSSLLEVHQPPLIVFTGLTYRQYPVDLFSLQGPVHKVVGRSGKCVVQHYTDGKRPWLICKHFSGSSFMTRDEADDIKQYIRKVRGGQS